MNATIHNPFLTLDVNTACDEARVLYLDTLARMQQNGGQPVDWLERLRQQSHLSRLIETAEIEPGKAETAERKKQGVRRMKGQSATRTAHAADGFWFPASLSSQETTVFPHVLQ